MKNQTKGKSRNFQRKKDFFEVFSYVFVGFMGIILSAVGININQQTMDIYNRQLKISENENSPYFDLEFEKVWDKVEKTKKLRKQRILNIH